MAAVAKKSVAKVAHKKESAPKENMALEFMPMENEYGIMPLRPSCACGGSCPRCKGDKDPGGRSTANLASVPLQTKVEVGQPGDTYEMEADRVAENVMRMPKDMTFNNHVGNAPSKIQRACTSCESDKEEKIDTKIQRNSTAGQEAQTNTESLPPTGSLDRSQLTSGGSALASETRSFFEPRFNRDLSAVKLHTGAVASEYCQQLDAHAFTYGNHVWLGKGLQASPSFVLAHELAHVVQQTQPNALNKNNHTTLKTTSHHSNKVQRLPFWVPIDTKLGDVMSGTALHSMLLKNPEGKNNVTTEAPVPNANRKKAGLGLQGFADLYRASSRVGVYFKPRQGLEPGDTEGNERHTHPAKPDRAGKDPKPVVTKTGTIEKINDGPKDIELGELKPAALTELTKGNEQLKNYEAGFKDAAKLTNLWGAGRTPVEKWSLNSVKRLPDKAVEVADEHKPNSKTAPDRDLALADIDESSFGQAKYSVKKLLVPKSYLGQNIPGKLFMEPFGQGLWMYYAKPNDFSKALDVAKLKTDKGYMKVAQDVQTEVIGNLLKGPKKITLKKRDASISRPPQLNLTSAPVKVFRKPKKTELKDDFDQKAFDAWSKKQTELGQEVRGKGKTGPTDNPFKKLEFLETAVKAEKELSPKAKTPGFPTATQLQEQVVTGTGKEKVTKNTSLDKLYNWMERWTSLPYKILGQFRLRFGGLFVTAANKFIQIKDGIHQKVHDLFTKKAGDKKSDKLLVKALKTALKQVINMVVPHTMSLVFTAIENGAKKQLAKLFEDTFVEKSIKQFETWHEEIKNYVDQVTNKMEKLKEDFLKDLKWIDSLLRGLGWFWKAVKAGRVLLKCRKPPILGCLSLLKDAATDDELNCILCIPWVQKQIAQRVQDVPWFANMPVELGNLILKTLHDAVPEKATILKEIFNEKITNPFISIDNIETECDAKCDGFPLFKDGGSGEVSQKDGETAKEIAELHDKLSKEEVEELLKKAKEKGLLDKPFDKKTAEDLLKKEPEKKPEAKESEGKEGEGKESDEKKPEAPPPGANPQGGGGSGGGKCTWSPSMLETGIWIESLGKATLTGPVVFNKYIQRTGDKPAFSNASIEAECSATLRIINDFYSSIRLDCPRGGNFTAPTVTTEITFDGKEIFKQTDKNPTKGALLSTPSWGRKFTLPTITKNGELKIKLTMFDPDTNITKTLEDKVQIIVNTAPNNDPCVCKLCVS